MEFIFDSHMTVEINNRRKPNGPNFKCTHCLDLNLNGKRPGVASDGNFSSYLIRRSGYG